MLQSLKLQPYSEQRPILLYFSYLMTSYDNGLVITALLVYSEPQVMAKTVVYLQGQVRLAEPLRK